MPFYASIHSCFEIVSHFSVRPVSMQMNKYRTELLNLGKIIWLYVFN
jgi:hypothetical protein